MAATVRRKIGEVHPRPSNDHSVGMPSLSAGTVLVVEDHEDNRQILSLYLSHMGYRVLTAGNGADGVSLARAERPDIVLMDIAMPVLDGYGALHALRHDPVLRGVPVVALTAHALPTDRETALSAGFDSYLAKPIEPRLVLAEIERILLSKRD